MPTTNDLRPYMLLTIFSLSSILAATVKSTIPKGETQGQGNTMITQFLNAHNKVRAKHHIPPFKWSSELANYAKWYGDQRSGDCALVHSDSKNYGENIFWGQGKRWRGSDAVAAWSIQENYYNYSSNTCMVNRDCLHYTQVVWRDSKYLGCAKTKCKTGDTYVVCEYFPYGNVIGERPY